MKSAFVLSSVAAVIAVSSLVSCGPGSLPEGYTGSVAVIRSSAEDVSFFKKKLYYVASVGGRNVESASHPMSTPGMMGGRRGIASEKEIEVPAQETTVRLRGETYYTAGAAAMVDSHKGGTRSVDRTVSFTPRAGGEYRVKGNLDTKGRESIWLEDEKTGKVVGRN